MRPAAPRLPVPSTCLLRFLRQQSERLFAIEDEAAIRTIRRGGGGGSSSSSSRRGRETTTGRLGLGVERSAVRPRWPATGPTAGPGGSLPAHALACFSTSRPTAQGWWTRRMGEQRQRQRQPPQPTKDMHAWHARLWGQRWGKKSAGGGAAKTSGSSIMRGGTATLLPGDLPDHGASTEFASVMFNARRLQTAKAALEPRLRCTEVDENGRVILVDGEFKKTELIAKYGLLPRDLRKIDSSNLPHILIRPAAILLNLLHLKVLIKADRVLLFDVYGSKTSYPQSAFLYDLQERLQQAPPPKAGMGAGASAPPASSGTSGTSGTSSSGSLASSPPSVPSAASNGLPYEFRALEAVLLSVTSELEAEFDTVREPVIKILSELEEDITRDKLRLLLVLSKKVSTFEQKAKLVRDAIEELLEADDDLAAMYLTEKRHGVYRGEDDHTEVEMLLESYHKICDEVAQEAGSLVSSIRNTEEITRAILDANRNALMLLELKFSIGTLGLAMGTFLAGLYGMNLENFIEDTNWGFGSVTTLSCVFSLFVCWYGLVKLRKVQRVKMHGVGGSGVGPTGDLGMLPPGLGYGMSHGPLDARSQERLRRLGMMRGSLMHKKYY